MSDASRRQSSAAFSGCYDRWEAGSEMIETKPPRATSPPQVPSGAATDRGNAASTAEVGAMFDRIAPRYDAMNALISGFQEPRWRRRAIALADLRPGMSAIDVATGTGKVAADLHARVQPRGSVVGVDISPAMIRIARHRFGDRAEIPGLEAHGHQRLAPAEH
jgi:SAM-dependent methyltransferase